MGSKEVFNKTFSDIKESAGAQHEVDEAQFEAGKAEPKAQWEEGQITNEEIRESGAMPHIIKAMEHDISDAPAIDPVAVYKAVEEGVVGAYKAVEKGVVDAYHKVEDTMVDKLFRREGETVEQAKDRLSKK